MRGGGFFWHDYASAHYILRQFDVWCVKIYIYIICIHTWCMYVYVECFIKSKSPAVNTVRATCTNFTESNCVHNSTGLTYVATATGRQHQSPK